jgi:1-phosphofructokinase
MLLVGTAVRSDDRRTCSRIEVATVAPASLNRHQLDDLYGVMLVKEIDAGLAVLAGTDCVDLVDPGVYERLAYELTANGCTVVADLRGEHLSAALR